MSYSICSEDLDQTKDEKQKEHCAFCKAPSPFYVCPRCKFPYCSLSCYNCGDHSGCSEEFYRECVETELREQRSDEKYKRKVEKAVAREQKILFEGENDNLEDRLASVDLEDPDKILEVLTDEQKRTFDRLVESNEIAKYISLWNPWWERRRALVKEVKADSTGECDTLIGFTRQCKESRPKIGGRKVQNLNKPKTKKEFIKKENEFLGTKQIVKEKITSTEEPSTNQSVQHEELRSVPSASTSAESQVEQTHSVCENIKRLRQDKKTRIVDSRHRKELSNVEGSQSGGMCKVNLNTKPQVNISTEDIRMRPKSSPISSPMKDIPRVVPSPETQTVREHSGISMLRTSPEEEGNVLLDSLIGCPKKSWTEREKTLASNIVNMIAAFAFLARFLNGDFKGNELEAADILQSICGVFKGQNFKMVDTAFCDVTLQKIVVGNARADLLIKDVRSILQNGEYIQRALCELRTLLRSARVSLRRVLSSGSVETNPDFTYSDELRKSFKLLILKVEFYSGWVTEEMINLQEWLLPQIELEIQKQESLLNKTNVYI